MVRCTRRRLRLEVLRSDFSLSNQTKPNNPAPISARVEGSETVASLMLSADTGRPDGIAVDRNIEIYPTSSSRT